MTAVHRVRAADPRPPAPAPPFARVAVREIRRTALSFARLVNQVPAEHTPRITRAARCRAQLNEWWPGDGVLEFQTQCSEPKSGGPWTQILQIPQWKTVLEADPDLNEILSDPDNTTPVTWPQVRQRLRQPIQNADILVWCDCPDFTYSGANFNVTQQQTAYPGLELFDPPDVQRSRGRGRALVCKHLVTVYFGYFS